MSARKNERISAPSGFVSIVGTSATPLTEARANAAPAIRSEFLNT
jgi:hypothetical protein